MFYRLALVLTVIGLFCSDSFSLSYRSALQMPEHLIKEINNSAIAVNNASVLDLMGSGASLDKGESVICAFPENKAGLVAADTLAGEIVKRFADKEIILTGYREAARYAGAIASRLSSKLEVNQLKLITFCGEKPFDSLDSIYLSCKLNFSHNFDAHDFQNGPWIELPVSLPSELNSKSSMILGAVGGLACGAMGCLCAWNSSWKVPVALVCFVGGALGSAVGKLIYKPSEYLPSDGVQSIFVRAKNRSWGAWTESDWRELGQ